MLQTHELEHSKDELVKATAANEAQKAVIVQAVAEAKVWRISLTHSVRT